MNTIGITAVYVGKRENIIAECAAVDPVSFGISAEKCRYLVLPIGEHDYDGDWLPTMKQALTEAKLLATEFGVKTCSV